MSAIWAHGDRLGVRSRAFLMDVLGRIEGPHGFDCFLPDGVYVGLPEELYFLQFALGSTDLAGLWLRKEGWWWKSKHNPHLPKARTSKERVFGSAAHALLLEGEEAFAERFAVKPDPRAFPELLETQDDIVSALRETEAPKGYERMKKSDQVELAKVYLPGRHIWDVIDGRFLRACKDREAITAEERWQLSVMQEAAQADPDMAAVMAASGGVRLTELSVFWTEADGTRLRFRFDSLLPPVNADLKTLGNVGDRTLVQAAGKAISDRALDVQAAMSFWARRRAYAFIGARQVWGGSESQRQWLARFPAEAPLDLGARPGWSWVWMFYEKADSNVGRAPAIFPVHMKFGGLRHRDGWRKVVHALDLYRHKVATVGLSKPWTRTERMHAMDAGPLPEIPLPPWAEQPMGVDGEEAAMSWRAEAIQETTP